MIKRVLFTNILLSRLYFHLNVCFITHYHSKKKIIKLVCNAKRECI